MKADQSEPSKHLRVLSYNIHKGFSTSKRRFVLPLIRDAIRDSQADVVFLQEVQGEHAHHARTTRDWPAASQFEFLAGELWPHFTYGKNAVYAQGHHGNAILSKYPIVETLNVDISTNAFEQRGMLHAIIALPGCTARVHAVCLHLGLTKRGRSIQLQKMCERLQSQTVAGEPVIVAGDFNDWSQVATKTLSAACGMGEVYKTLHGKYARTFPSHLPMLALDRIYFRDLEPLQALTLTGEQWRRLSDHAAISAEFTYPK